MKSSIKVTGLDDFEQRLIALAEMPGIDAALLKSAEQLRAEAVRELRAQLTPEPGGQGGLSRRKSKPWSAR